LAFKWFEATKEMLQLIQKRHCLVGRRLAAQEVLETFGTLVALGRFQAWIPFARFVALDLAKRFMNGDPHQELEEVVLILKLKSPFLDSLKKSAKHGLDDVFRIHPTG